MVAKNEQIIQSDKLSNELTNGPENDKEFESKLKQSKDIHDDKESKKTMLQLRRDHQ